MAREKDQNHAPVVRGTAGPLSPQKPYTGDGRTKRDTFDHIEVVERDADGRRR